VISTRSARVVLAVTLTLTLAAGALLVSQSMGNSTLRSHFVAYFDNSSGIFAGDEVRILGVPVGAVEAIEPQPTRAKITFWVDRAYRVPADAKAVIVAPQLVTARAVQLTPAYAGGPTLPNGAVIPQDRTAVPVEWDDLRAQLDKLTAALQPTAPGGVSTLGAVINTAADNLRGQGASIRDTVIKTAQALSALADHSGDIFGTVKNLSILASALQSSTESMALLNRNMAAVTALLANDPDEVGQAVQDLDAAVADVGGFVADNRAALGISFDRLSSISQAIADSLDDVKQALHILPDTAAGLSNSYQPAQAALTGALMVNNFANPISFLCGAIQAASRLGAAQSAKLCVQYLAPIVKNRQYNFLPVGFNLFAGAEARPNEVTYSEDWMRPDHVPTPEPAQPAIPSTVTTDPADGLPGMMVAPGGGR